MWKLSEFINSASENESNGTGESETSNNKYFSDFIKLQSYMYEPCVSSETVKENCLRKKWSDKEEDTSKVRNTLWCYCGKYKPMAAHAESACCYEKYEIDESYFKGILSFVSEIFSSSHLLRRK